MQTEVRRHAEYAALRATIRERGTARMLLIPFVFTAWAGVAIATSAVIAVALSTLVPLLVLAAGFEATFALYTNVERLGRYLQVFHEQDAAVDWEHVSMEFGRRFSDGGPDPLFARLFMTAVSVNFLPVTLGGTTVEIVVLALLHFVFIFRMRHAQTAAQRKRAIDLDRFQTLATARATPGGARDSSTVL
jgi:hypothetical protein